MSNTFTKLNRDKLNEDITALLCPKIQIILNNREQGHCMRITDMDEDIMMSVCQKICKEQPGANVYILSGDETTKDPNFISSTKLVELRNPLPDGSLRPPLLVFIPTSLRTSAEDSFGIATFEELSFANLYQDLVSSLLERVPATLVGYVLDIFTLLNEEKWQFSDDLSKARYLLTALTNKIDGESLGASLYELTLIPDFKLFEDPSLIRGKIQKNLECGRQLMNSHKSVLGRILNLKLNDIKVKNHLLSFFEQYEIHEPEIWTRYIALEKNNWAISFDKWNFQEGIELDKISIIVHETDLPIITEEEDNEQLSALIGQQVLVPDQRKSMKVIYGVAPHPNKVRGLDYFTVQIASVETGPVGKSKKINVWKGGQKRKTVSLTKLNTIDFEEGWHYIRVLPWTEDGDQIPINGTNDTTGSTHHSYESEPFYVLPGGSVEEEPKQRARPIEISLEHALMKLQLIAINDGRDPFDVHLTGVSWDQSTKKSKTALQETLLIKFGRDGTVQIPVSRKLKDIEQKILNAPTKLCGWRMQINLDSHELKDFLLSLPSSASMQSFLSAREKYFSAICKDTPELILQGTSLTEIRELCISYAESYLYLISTISRQAEQSTGSEQQKHLKILRHILALDSIHVVLKDYCGHHKEAVLVAPTHPLRSIWLLAWSNLGHKWISELHNGSKDSLSSVRSAILDGIQPSGFPIGIPVEDGRIFTPIDNLNFFWGMYAPTTGDNSRALLANICSVLGLPEPKNTVNTISGDLLAEKIDRYLSQHPYIRNLSINIFNPGSGSLVTDALIALQQKREYADLRYDIRLFTSDSESPTLGEALEKMLIRGTSVKDKATDAFATSTGSHLFPKLTLAKHPISDFDGKAQNYNAHITILFDAFPAEELGIEETEATHVPLYGLIQDYSTQFVDDQNGIFWRKIPSFGTSLDLQDGEGSFDLLTTLSQTVCHSIATVATAGANFNAVPTITLGLNIKQRELIHSIHQSSDWVFTIDRNMGVEFFDHGGKKERPDYLIDYVPNASSYSTHNLIISSRSTDELEAMLKPVLDSHGLSVDDAQLVKILSQLRSLSGQLALKLISSETQQAEALGLALARLYLEHQGALSNQIIVPLDAHTDLYRNSRAGDEVEDAVSLQRTDLALFDLDLKNRLITCNLIEVKCYSYVGNFSEFNQLKVKIASQITQSERILQRHFDPGIKTPDRPDRLVKSHELAQLLKFYLDRSVRYGIFDGEAAEEANAFIESIEYGYSLQFSRSGIIFDFEKPGTEDRENEVGIEYHRIGKNLIKALLNVSTTSISEEVLNKEKSLDISDEQIISEVPKLKTAAFIAPSRNRTTTWDFRSTDWDDLHDVDDPSIPVRTADINSSDDVNVEKDQELPSEDMSEKETRDSSKVQNSSYPVNTTSTLVDEIKEEDTSFVYESKDKCEEIEPENISEPDYDVLLGFNGDSPQYGILGEVSNRKIAIDLNSTHTISLFGVQGGGKSYTLGSIIEMASMPIDNLNMLPSPLATVVFHYSPTDDYRPEFTSMINPNSVEEEIRILKEKYGGNPKGLQDIIILTPADKVEARQAEYPNIQVMPIAFSPSELKANHWKFLMGAIGNQSMYIRQINHIMKKLRNNLTLDNLESGIQNSNLSDHLRDLALTRLQFASEYINESGSLQDLIRPGRLVIVDLRDEYIEKDEALGLFVVMLQIFSEAKYKNASFNKLVVFDEAHKYIESPDLVSGLVEVVREMRHKGTSIMVASQDPPSVPTSIIELSTHIIMHKFNSPNWLKHIQKANASLKQLTPEKMSQLRAGEAYAWSSKATDESFVRGAIKIKCRPRATQHGGSTKTAVSSSQKSESQ